MDLRSLPARALSLAVLLGGCGDDEPAARETVEVASMPASAGAKLDVAMVVDDSSGTLYVQNALADHLYAVLEPLDTAAGGALDLHVGVTTSDYGTTALADPANPAPQVGTPGNGGCDGAGRDGALRVSGAPVTDAYLVDGPTKNYTGTRRDALGQMVRVGTSGCAFEQPLAASARLFTNPANAGFRRPDANLLVLFVQNEDDCSVADASLFFRPESPTLGPLSSIRCTRFGVKCDEPMADIGPKTNCHASLGSQYIADVAPFVAQYRALVPDPARLVVGVIAAPAEPVAIEERKQGASLVPALVHSCEWKAPDDNVTTGDPAVRMQSLVEEAGVHGSMTTVCSADLGPSFTELARVAKQMFGVACLDTATLAAPLACTAKLVTDGIEAPLPACPASGACFELLSDPVACPERAGHTRLVVHDAPAGAYIRASCELPSYEPT